jgi:multisubunit Na+/H+ antiporter MnhE subunit
MNKDWELNELSFGFLFIFVALLNTSDFSRSFLAANAIILASICFFILFFFRILLQKSSVKIQQLTSCLPSYQP